MQTTVSIVSAAPHFYLLPPWTLSCPFQESAPAFPRQPFPDCCFHGSVLPVKLYRNGTLPHLLFCVWLTKCFWNPFLLWCVFVHSFLLLLLRSVPLYGYAAICLFSCDGHWGCSSLGPLWRKMLLNSLNKFLWGHVFISLIHMSMSEPHSL